MYLISSGPDRVKLTKEGDLSFFNKIEEVSYKGLLASLCLLNVPIREYWVSRGKCGAKDENIGSFAFENPLKNL